MRIWRGVRHFLATHLLDAPRYGLVLRFPALARRFGHSWVDLHNRGQRLIRRPGQRGVVCADLWASALFYCQAYPAVGNLLLRRALADWPVALCDVPPTAAGKAQVTFIIGHRGTARARHLLATLASLAAQAEVPIEAVVVEQAPASELTGLLPGWVRHVHTPPPRADMPYSRSWAFNVGARQAHGRILVFHDNDVLVPTRYAAELVRVFAQGFEAARLQRCVFYLSEPHSEDIFRRRWVSVQHPPLEAVQNCQGHTLAVARDVYFAVGGHDEAFLGWGGEDNEMFDRLRTRRLHDCSYLPFLHLYHPAQPGKGATNPNTSYFETRMKVPASERVRDLLGRAIGCPDGPATAVRRFG